jgi:hypothetical protein
MSMQCFNTSRITLLRRRPILGKRTVFFGGGGGLGARDIVAIKRGRVMELVWIDVDEKCNKLREVTSFV